MHPAGAVRHRDEVSPEGRHLKNTTHSELFERRLEFDDAELARDLFGPRNEHLDLIAERIGVRIDTRGSSAILRAEEPEAAAQAADLLIQLYGLLRKGVPIYPSDVDNSLGILSRDPDTNLGDLFRKNAQVVSPKKTIIPKSLNQREFLSAIKDCDLVFGIGPAGTGKTYLAVAMAVAALLERRVKRVVLVRPAVEAGEKLGYLPGDLKEKVDPYLRPLYDALNEMMDARKVREMLESGVIEAAPLAYMRGRTLNDAFIILDEAQNATPPQMKMFLTRLGLGSKAVVNGDVTQIDLPPRTESGLVQAERVLQGVRGARFVHFDENDVVRRPLVARIVQAYERFDRENTKEN